MKFFSVLILVLLPLAQVHAATQNSCSKTLAPGEPVEGRFMPLEYALITHVLAEKLCMASPKPMPPRFLGYLERHGCGHGTEIYTVFETAIAKMQGASLKQLAQNGDSTLSLSDKQVQEWASSTLKAVGGCEGLKEAHDMKLER